MSSHKSQRKDKQQEQEEEEEDKVYQDSDLKSNQKDETEINQETIISKIENGTVSGDEIENRFNKVKKTKQGEDLVNARHKILLDYYSKKMTVEEAQQLVKIEQEGQNIDEEQKKKVSKASQQAEQWAKTAKTILKSPQKPVKKLFEHLVSGLSNALKSQQSDEILDTWYKSAKWNTKAKLLITDRLSGGYLQSHNNSNMEQSMNQRDSSEQQWTAESVSELIEQLNSNGIIVDKSLAKIVKDKAKIIQNLKSNLPDILQTQHDIKKLREYAKSLRECENIDFSNEIEKTEEKIRLMLEIQNVVKNELKNKISIDTYESLYNQLKEAEDENKKEYLIKLPAELVEQIETKTKAVLNIKSRIQGLMDRNSNTFTKSMAADLKNLIQEAVQEYNLDMKKETKILENIAFSEEWFLSTFEKLKVVAGKALHQIDFKDFEQVETVIKNERELDSLLQCADFNNLVGAAQNLWTSLSGAKWLISLKKVTNQNQREASKIIECYKKSKKLGIDLNREGPNSAIFKELENLNETVHKYTQQFASHSKIMQTLDQNKNRLAELLAEVQQLGVQLAHLKVNTESNELETLAKVRTYIEFTQQYQQYFTLNNKLPQEKAMILQQQVKEQKIPEDLPIIKRLNESVARFEKFKKDYSDYKKFRERMKKQGAAITINPVDTKFTVQFLQKLIADSQSLGIDLASDYFDKSAMDQDLKQYNQWKVQADLILGQFESDEITLNSEELKERFEQLKSQMKSVAAYDRNTFAKIQAFNWYYSALRILEPTENQEVLSLGTWEGILKQADQFETVIKDIQSHSIYQRLYWEIDQSKIVIDFVNQQKNNMKSLAARYNQDKTQSYAIFRNKNAKIKLSKLLDQAKVSKIDLLDEIRCLEGWIKDFETITGKYDQGDIYTTTSYERLKEMAKSMYMSPIDYGEVYFDVKTKLDNADNIRQNLKRILQEYDYQYQAAKAKNKDKIKRLRFSRVSYDLKCYYKDCNIQGIKEIDIVIEKVKQSKQKLAQVKLVMDQLQDITDQNEMAQKLDEAKILYSEVEIGLESEESDVKRDIFECDLKLIFESEKPRKLQLEEFKELDHQYEQVRNHIRNEQLHAKFITNKAKVNELMRRINKVQDKEELKKLTEEANTQCSFVDFSQLIIEKDAQFLLGKRKVGPSENDENNISLKRQKKEEDSKSSQESEDNSSSSSSSDSSSSSGSSSDSSSSSGEESDDSSDSSANSVDSGNLARNRARRTIVPNLNPDFIYDAQSTSHIKTQETSQPPLTEEQKKQLKKDNKVKKKELKREKKRREKEKIKREAYLKEQREKSTKEKMRRFGKDDQGNGIGSMIVQDRALQDSLQIMKIKIRDQSKKRIRECLELKDSVFSQLSKDQIKEIVVDLENEAYSKHPETDTFYRKKIGDICENIKFLKDYKDVAETIALKKTISFSRLAQAHHSFKDSVVKVQARINEKKIARQKEIQQAKQLAEEEAKEEIAQESQQEVSVAMEQNLMPALYPSTSRQQLQDQHNQHRHQMPIVKTIEDDSDEVQSMDDYPAQFSDDENNKKAAGSSELNYSGQYDPYQQVHSPYGAGMDWTGSEFGDSRSYQYVPPRILQYNPFEIVEQQQRSSQKKQTEPILYDPTLSKNSNKRSNIIKERNNAPVGSLLKIWEGQLELAKDNIFSSQFFSLHDITTFQSLPELPITLPLKGKAKTSEVINHFLRLKKDKNVIRGWAVRKGNYSQDNSDKYNKLFDELDTGSKSALFNVFPNVTFYLLPITSKTKEFCRQMGIKPERTINSINNEKGLSQDDTIDIDALFQEETHFFALLSQIKQSFSSKTNFLNPDVIRRAAENALQTQVVKKEKSFSPITSDEDENPREQHKAKILSSVKNDDQQDDTLKLSSQNTIISSTQLSQPVTVQQASVTQEQTQQNRPPVQQQQQQPPIVNQPREDDNEIDIDDLIAKFKNQEYDIQSIQSMLVPIIHTVKGEKEQKLMAFLKELINKYYGPGGAQQNNIQEETSNVYGGGAGAGYQQNIPINQQASYIQQSHQGEPPSQYNPLQQQQQYIPPHKNILPQQQQQQKYLPQQQAMMAGGGGQQPQYMPYSYQQQQQQQPLSYTGFSNVRQQPPPLGNMQQQQQIYGQQPQSSQGMMNAQMQPMFPGQYQQRQITPLAGGVPVPGQQFINPLAGNSGALRPPPPAGTQMFNNQQLHANIRPPATNATNYNQYQQQQHYQQNPQGRR